MADIIDYIIDQADRYDKSNIQYEQDIIYRINKRIDKMVDNCVLLGSDISTQLQLETLLKVINTQIDNAISDIKKILLDVAESYSDMAYNNVGDLIDIGKEVSGRFDEHVNEQKIEYDNDTIEWIQKYSFDLLSGYSQNKKNELRSKLGYALLTGDGNKARIRDIIQKVLNTNKSKSEEIAQSELSMAYNAGTIRRMKEYNKISTNKMKKYWHGFRYSPDTCQYCLDRIGSVYDLDDDSETLPAHVRCRCTWLPYMDSWDKPVTNKLIAKANLLNTAYSEEMIYNRINNRLDIDYSQYLNKDEAVDFLSGNRSTKISKAMERAKKNYISDKIDQFDIKQDNTNTKMSKKYNEQMKFWKNTVAEAMADRDYILLDNCKEAIKGVMLLPWTAEQLAGWDKLINNINK